TSRPVPGPAPTGERRGGRWSSWRGPGTGVSIGGRVVRNGMLYTGHGPGDKGEFDNVQWSSAIDLGLEVEGGATDPWEEIPGPVGGYGDLNPRQRDRYLLWLTDRYGYEMVPPVFPRLFFYGLERRVVETVRAAGTPVRFESGLQEELSRLAGHFQADKDFLAVVRALLTLVNVAAQPSRVVMTEPPAYRPEDDGLPFALLRGLGNLARHDALLPAAWAVEWALHHVRPEDPQRARRTARERVGREARSLRMGRFATPDLPDLVHQYRSRCPGLGKAAVALPGCKDLSPVTPPDEVLDLFRPAEPVLPRPIPARPAPTSAAAPAPAAPAAPAGTAPVPPAAAASGPPAPTASASPASSVSAGSAPAPAASAPTAPATPAPPASGASGPATPAPPASTVPAPPAPAPPAPDAFAPVGSAPVARAPVPAPAQESAPAPADAARAPGPGPDASPASVDAYLALAMETARHSGRIGAGHRVAMAGGAEGLGGATLDVLREHGAHDREHLPADAPTAAASLARLPLRDRERIGDSLIGVAEAEGAITPGQIAFLLGVHRALGLEDVLRLRLSHRGLAPAPGRAPAPWRPVPATVPDPAPVPPVNSLPRARVRLLLDTMSRPLWSRADFTLLAAWYGCDDLEAVDVLNEAAIDITGADVLDEKNGVIKVRTEVLEEMTR
ncbi:TerB N-terminal domain-containing protein, partial [Nocardiopsis protaetiae]